MSLDGPIKASRGEAHGHVFSGFVLVSQSSGISKKWSAVRESVGYVSAYPKCLLLWLVVIS